MGGENVMFAGDVRKTPWQANIMSSDYQLLAACLKFHPKKTFQESLRRFLILGSSTYDYVCLEGFISQISLCFQPQHHLIPFITSLSPSPLLHYYCHLQSLSVSKSISFVLLVCKWSRWIEGERS